MTEDGRRLTISVDEAAKRLGVARNSLYAAIRRGEFRPVIRIGKRILVPAVALEKRLSGESDAGSK